MPGACGPSFSATRRVEALKKFQSDLERLNREHKEYNIGRERYELGLINLKLNLILEFIEIDISQTK